MTELIVIICLVLSWVGAGMAWHFSLKAERERKKYEAALKEWNCDD